MLVSAFCLSAVSGHAAEGDEILDAFTKPWVPSTPVIQALAPVPPGPAAPPDLSLELSALPSVHDLRTTHVFHVPVFSIKSDPQVTAAEREAFGHLLTQYHAAGAQASEASIAILEAYLTPHADSAFSLCVRLETARLTYALGWFDKARQHYDLAWEQGRLLTLSPEVKRFADTALIQVLELSAALGHKERVKSAITQAKTRGCGGAATAAVDRAKEMMWFWDHQAEQNVFCGFTALNSIATPRGFKPIYPDIDDPEKIAACIRDGLSAAELAKLSEQPAGKLKVIKRVSGNVIPTPSVVHWNFSHYSALTELKGGQYHLEDKHLRFNSLVSAQAVNAQASGYFLIFEDEALPPGFELVPDEEALAVHGRHCTHSIDDDDVDALAGGDGGPSDNPVEDGPGDGDENCGMAGYSFRSLNASLVITDTPLRHFSPRGQPVSFQLVYDFRSASIVDTDVNISNLGPRWTHGFNSYIEINATEFGQPPPQVTAVLGNGSRTIYDNPDDGVYSSRYKDHSRLIKTTSGFEMRARNGNRWIFNRPNASPVASRYMMTQAIDPWGNTLTLEYDSQNRISNIRDALNRATTLGYTPASGDGVSSDTFKIRSITDPFGRSASLRYHSDGRLKSITDPIDIKSEFAYEADDFISSLTTPYGKTKFRKGDSGGIARASQFIEAQDPLGDKERLEQNDLMLPEAHQEAQMAPGTILVASESVSFMPSVERLGFRNTFYWSKAAMAKNPGSADHAWITNWLAEDNKIVGVPASTKAPGEGRIWYNYDGQESEFGHGNTRKASKVVRAVEKPDGTVGWICTRAAYDNEYGNPTFLSDAEGRKSRSTYYGNDLDLHTLEAWDPDLNDWVVQTTYSNYINGSPQTVTDVSGRVTTYTYNSYGQTTSTTVAKGGVTRKTRFKYDRNRDGVEDTDGYLWKVEQASQVGPDVWTTMQTKTYDSLYRVHTSTDTAGYTVTYAYDNFDRVTQVTQPNSKTEQYRYDKLDLAAVKDKNGLWTRHLYNPIRKLVATQDPQGRITTMAWCRCGQIRQITDPAGRVTKWERDTQGRVLKKILPDNRFFTYDYHPLSGRERNVWLPKDGGIFNASYTSHYDGSGNMVKRVYGTSSLPMVKMFYDDFLGRLTKLEEGTGSSLRTTVYSYHPLATTPNGATRLASVNGPEDDDTVLFEYDEMGRVHRQKIVTDDVTPIVLWDETITVDQLDRTKTMVNPMGTWTVGYTAGDASSNAATVTAPTAFGIVSTFTRNAVNAVQNPLAMTNARHAIGSTTVSEFSYGYDDAGRLTSLGINQGTGPQSPTPENWTLGYNRTSELTDVSRKNVSTNLELSAHSYQYDLSGNRITTATKAAPQPQTATYNSRNQMVSIGGGGNTLIQGVVNEVSSVKVNSLPAAVVSIPGTNDFFFSREVPVSSGTNSFTVEAKDTQNNTRTSSYQMQVPALQRSLEYDFNGNLVRKTEPPPVGSSISPGAQKFEWDVLSRLTAWQERETPEENSRRIEWTYDSFDRRIRATHKVWDDGEWSVERQDWFYHIGVRQVQKRVDGSTSARTDYYDIGERRTAPGITLNLAYTRDRLGSVREMVDSTQTVRGRYTYDPYGVRTKVFGLECDFGFTGHEYEPASRLHLTTYRAYDAELGRWISEDPLGEAGGLNLYGYVFGSPTNGVDPLGLDIYDSMPDWMLHAIGSNFVKNANNFAAGATDVISMGLSKTMRDYAWGDEDPVDECSDSYWLGEIAGMAVDVAAAAKKGAATAADDVLCQIGCFTEGTPVATAEGDKPIESLKVGDRVLNTGTIAGENTATEVIPSEWRKLVLRMALPDQPGNAVEVVTLRSAVWCAEHQMQAGALMPLDLEHLGLSGPARILSIDPCPQILPGEGRVVLSTFTHYNTDVYALRLEGCDEVLHPTGRHPLFSVMRNDWVALNELAEGDLLQTRTGPKKIASLGRKPGMHRVYNMEVEGEHCYYVGQAEVLGHNMALCKDVKKALRKLSQKNGVHERVLSDRFHKLKSYGETPGAAQNNFVDDLTGDVFDGNKNFIGNLFE